jgi:hypothetical protein
MRCDLKLCLYMWEASLTLQVDFVGFINILWHASRISIQFNSEHNWSKSFECIYFGLESQFLKIDLDFLWWILIHSNELLPKLSIRSSLFSQLFILSYFSFVIWFMTWILNYLSLPSHLILHKKPCHILLFVMRFDLWFGKSVFWFTIFILIW